MKVMYLFFIILCITLVSFLHIGGLKGQPVPVLEPTPFGQVFKIPKCQPISENLSESTRWWLDGLEEQGKLVGVIRQYTTYLGSEPPNSIDPQRLCIAYLQTPCTNVGVVPLGVEPGRKGADRACLALNTAFMDPQAGLVVVNVTRQAGNYTFYDVNDVRITTYDRVDQYHQSLQEVMGAYFPNWSSTKP